MWRPGLEPPAIDAIYRWRPGSGADPASEELLVKFRAYAHTHTQWVPRGVLERSGPVTNARRVQRFLKELRQFKPALGAEGGSVGVAIQYDDDEPAYDPQHEEVERVLACRLQPDGPRAPHAIGHGHVSQCGAMTDRRLLESRAAVRPSSVLPRQVARSLVHAGHVGVRRRSSPNMARAD